MYNEQYDKYIEKSGDFAQAILTHLRNLVHKACPEVDETMKWSFPNFVYKKSILCSMASFKHHCAFGFWHGAIMDDPDKILNNSESSAMGQFGRITKLSDLPSDEIIIQYLHQAMGLIDKGVKVPKTDPSLKEYNLEIPIALQQALQKNDKAMATFEKFSNSNKKEYIVWINEAKTEVTKQKRLETTIEWLEEGKIKNWKYVK